MFDVWEFPEKCKKCGRYDNHDKTQPACYLDVKTKLCEFCYDENEDNEEVKGNEYGK